jgi:PRC-barrel domain protein
MERKGFLTVVTIIVLVCAVTLGGAASVSAQVAGTATIAISAEQMKLVALGWSAKKQIMGKPVYNDANEKIGTIDDLIITPDQSVSYAIIGVGGFIGLGKRNVAIPVGMLKQDNGKLVLPGATKDAVKAMPKFEYAM